MASWDGDRALENCTCCGSAAAHQRCSGCKVAVYCSATCQKKQWKTQHRGQCGFLRALRRSLDCFGVQSWKNWGAGERGAGERGAGEQGGAGEHHCVRQDTLTHMLLYGRLLALYGVDPSPGVGAECDAGEDVVGKWAFASTAQQTNRRVASTRVLIREQVWDSMHDEAAHRWCCATCRRAWYASDDGGACANFHFDRRAHHDKAVYPPSRLLGLFRTYGPTKELITLARAAMFATMHDEWVHMGGGREE